MLVKLVLPRGSLQDLLLMRNRLRGPVWRRLEVFKMVGVKARVAYAQPDATSLHVNTPLYQWTCNLRCRARYACWHSLLRLKADRHKGVALRMKLEAS